MKIAVVKEFKFHKDEISMGYAKFDTKDDAVKVLVECHNTPFKTRYLKISFAKQPF